MMITGITAALNTAIKPAILYHAAIAEIDIAVTNIRRAKNIFVLYCL
jgi:hypothetical protein